MKKLLKKIRFIIADILNIGEKRCWADLAFFGMGYSKKKHLFKTDGKSCKAYSTREDGLCDCGKFYKGELSKNSIELKELIEKQKQQPDEFPF